jgi:hypothetical protein
MIHERHILGVINLDIARLVVVLHKCMSRSGCENYISLPDVVDDVLYERQ